MGTAEKQQKRVSPPSVRAPKRPKRSTLDFVGKTSYKARPVDLLCLQHAPGDTMADRLRSIFDDYDDKSRTGSISPRKLTMPRHYEHTYENKLISWHQSIDHWQLLDDIRQRFDYRMHADAIRHVFDHYAEHEGVVRELRSIKSVGKP